ncbi:molybdate transport system regulatory protein [Halorubrum alkaliphilum]|uniref:Molybdate transport system regulatory protein n=1 Tax=Halorubrum alkaliphilum TaxID=261290 RepID=A0A8T4GE31_9EURY|nr:TOBE domain-containing protein [Halorubrum alkaliphilum]MBP1921910.1 molybdate transport system regulatory protein [Halorubrum alkaliphilum]
MDEPSGHGRAALVREGVEFDERDVSLLRAIDETGSIAKASTDLGRSRARELSRIETLESAFGDLVERSRGGSGGGGSTLTDTARQLIHRYERLQTALSATAQVPETVLDGTVSSVSGELADVTTTVGTVRGLHHGVAPDDAVQIRIGADALTVLDPAADPEPGSTSARNRLPGAVSGIVRGETVCTVGIDIDGTTFRALVTAESADRLELVAGRDVVITWKATATRLVQIKNGRSGCEN